MHIATCRSWLPELWISWKTPDELRTARSVRTDWYVSSVGNLLQPETLCTVVYGVSVIHAQSVVFWFCTLLTCVLVSEHTSLEYVILASRDQDVVSWHVAVEPIGQLRSAVTAYTAQPCLACLQDHCAHYTISL